MRPMSTSAKWHASLPRNTIFRLRLSLKSDMLMKRSCATPRPSTPTAERGCTRLEINLIAGDILFTGRKIYRETQIKSTVRPELVEGFLQQIDCYRFNPFMVRQACPERSRRAHHERIKSAFP